MSYLRNAIYTSIRTAPRTIGKLFKSRRPQEGDDAAERLTARVMDVLESYEVTQKTVRSGWMPDDDGSGPPDDTANSG